MRELIKQLIKLLPWALTFNERYDRQTKKIISKLCKPDSVCIDVGCFKGDILEKMISSAPDARHIAFEPIPEQFKLLTDKFSDRADIHPYALGKTNHTTTFHHVVSNPTYSGLKQRQYKGKELINEINVDVRRMDDVIQDDIPIRLIKIDVEGGEYDVLQGAERLLLKWKPYLIFEHGIGGADKYNVEPGDIYNLLAAKYGYKLGIMGEFLKHKNMSGFNKQEFERQFNQQLNCYFIAVP